MNVFQSKNIEQTSKHSIQTSTKYSTSHCRWRSLFLQLYFSRQDFEQKSRPYVKKGGRFIAAPFPKRKVYFALKLDSVHKSRMCLAFEISQWRRLIFWPQQPRIYNIFAREGGWMLGHSLISSQVLSVEKVEWQNTREGRAVRGLHTLSKSVSEIKGAHGFGVYNVSVVQKSGERPRPIFVHGKRYDSDVLEKNVTSVRML